MPCLQLLDSTSFCSSWLLIELVCLTGNAAPVDSLDDLRVIDPSYLEHSDDQPFPGQFGHAELVRIRSVGSRTAWAVMANASLLF